MLATNILSWKQLSQRQRKPVHLILFITDQCNAKCGTCFYWQNLNQGEALQSECIDKISAGMGQLVWLDISGGEPFLRKDIDRICHLFLDHNQAEFINIPTNALQTEVIRRSVERILANCNNFRLNIAISLDGIAENHDRIRGVPGNYQRALATMESPARNSHPRQTALPQRSHHRDEQQHRRCEDTAQPWGDEMGSGLPLAHILRGNWMDPALQAPTPRQYEEISKLQLELCRRYFHGRWGGIGG